MTQISYILFGWVLGLISPSIVDLIKSYFRRREIKDALRIELEDLQFRLAISSFLLLQRYGELTKDFLIWIQPILEKYSGDEPHQNARQIVRQLITADEQELTKVAE